MGGSLLLPCFLHTAQGAEYVLALKDNHPALHDVGLLATHAVRVAGDGAGRPGRPGALLATWRGIAYTPHNNLVHSARSLFGVLASMDMPGSVFVSISLYAG
jgi:hypothetical protein